MTQTPPIHAPSEPPATEAEVPAAPPHVYPEQPDEPSLLLGRPIEDRAFEIMEGGIGLTAGLVIGTAVAGPVGAAVGGIAGAAAGLLAGEALERRVGPAAARSDATEPVEEETAPADAEAAYGRAHDLPPTFAYPTNYLLAMAATPEIATAARAALAAAGFADGEVAVITAENASEQPAPIASHHRHLASVMRAVQAATMDQVPSLRVYEEALAAGRDVVAVHVRAQGQRVAAQDALETAGATYLNFYGRWSTVELSRSPMAEDPAAAQSS